MRQAAKAEYEGVLPEDLTFYSGRTALQQFPIVAKPRKGTFLLIGERGSGKSRLAKALAVELNDRGIPASYHRLRRGTQEYECLVGAPNPRVIIVDDMHLQQDCTSILRHEAKPHTSFPELLEIWENFQKEAYVNNGKVIFVTNQGFAATHTNFLEDGQIERYARLHQACATNADDAAVLSKFLGSVSIGHNVLEYRKRIDAQTALGIRKEFGMTDVPLFNTPTAVTIYKGRVLYSREPDARYLPMVKEVNSRAVKHIVTGDAEIIVFDELSHLLNRGKGRETDEDIFLSKVTDGRYNLCSGRVEYTFFDSRSKVRIKSTFD